MVFSAKLDGVATARAVDQLISDPAWNREGDRAVYQELFDAIEHVRTTGDRVVVPFERWAIVSVPVEDDEPDDPPSVWSGPDLDTLDWEPIDGDAKCAIVDIDDWPISRAEREDWSLVLDERQVTRRPLLPHESTCQDVADMRALLGL
jgi:hypothetical protein